MPRLWASDFRKILIVLLNDLYMSNTKLKGLQSYGPSKLAVKKILDLLGLRLRFSRVYSVSLLFGRLGFDSWTAQTLRACSFAALWPARVYSSSFESPITCLLVFKRVGA